MTHATPDVKPATTPEQIAAYVDSASALLGLDLTASQRPGVLGFFALAKGYADIVQSVHLEPHQDSVMTFTPISPSTLSKGSKA